MIGERRRPSAEDRQNLDASRDPRTVKRAASAFAASPAPEDHVSLAQRLASQSFLERLDPAERYAGTIANLRLTRVVQILMDSRDASAHQALVWLLAAPAFQSHVLRMQLSVRALGVVRPSPPPAIQYWDRYSSPASPIAHDVIAALVVNQSPPAMQLLEGKLAAPAPDRFVKRSWMRELILPRRNDEPLLACCGRLVTRTLPAELRPDLVEALFHYKPEEWYIGCEVPKPPPLAAASARAKEMFQQIGRFALEQVALNPGQRIVVEDAVEKLTGGAAA